LALLKLDYYDKFMRAYVDGESKRTARSKLGIFLDDMGFKEQDFKGLKNDELKETKINDLRKRCNDFCNEFKERFASEGIEGCQDILMSYLDSLKNRAKEGKLNGGTIRNRKFTIKRLVEKTMNIKDIDWEGLFEGLPEPSRFAQDRIYTMDEIRQICKYTDPRIKPIVYFFVSGGIRLGAWDYLKWGHINPQERNGKIVCALVEVYKDTPEQYPTLITVEAYNALKEWMEFRERSGEIITPDSWVMRDYWDTEEGFTHGIAKEAQQLKSSGIKSLIDSAVRRQGLRKNLTNGKKRHDVQLNHSYRKFRETQLIRAGLKLVDVNILQGHANGGMVDHYYRPSADPNNRIDDYLITEFLKAERYLTVDDNHDISEFKEELQYYKSQIKELKKENLLTKFNQVMEMLEEKVLKLNKNLKISPQVQIDYYVKARGKLVKPEEIELLNELVKEGEIREITVSKSEGEEPALAISTSSKYELEDYKDQIKEIEERDKGISDEEWKKGIRKNLELKD
jgi:integrase